AGTAIRRAAMNRASVGLRIPGPPVNQPTILRRDGVVKSSSLEDDFSHGSCPGRGCVQGNNLRDGEEEGVGGEEEGSIPACRGELHLGHEEGEAREDQGFSEHAGQSDEEGGGCPVEGRNAAPPENEDANQGGAEGDDGEVYPVAEAGCFKDQ